MKSEDIPVPIVINALKHVTGKSEGHLMEIFSGTVLSKHQHDDAFVVSEEELKELIEKFYNKKASHSIKPNQVARAAITMMQHDLMKAARDMQRKMERHDRQVKRNLSKIEMQKKGSKQDKDKDEKSIRTKWKKSKDKQL